MERHQQRNRVVGDVFRSVIGHVAHFDSRAPASRHVDDIITDSETGNHFAILETRSDLAGNRNIASDNGDRIAGPLDHLFPRSNQHRNQPENRARQYLFL